MDISENANDRLIKIVNWEWKTTKSYLPLKALPTRWPRSVRSNFRSVEERSVIVMTKLNICIRHRSGLIRYRTKCNHNMPYLCHNGKTAMVLFPEISYSRYIPSAVFPARNFPWIVVQKKSVIAHEDIYLFNFSIFMFRYTVIHWFMALENYKSINRTMSENVISYFRWSFLPYSERPKHPHDNITK